MRMAGRDGTGGAPRVGEDLLVEEAEVAEAVGAQLRVVLRREGPDPRPARSNTTTTTTTTAMGQTPTHRTTRNSLSSHKNSVRLDCPEQCRRWHAPGINMLLGQGLGLSAKTSHWQNRCSLGREGVFTFVDPPQTDNREWQS